VQTNYIKEIQSLRGISILLVFLFHLNQDYFPLGYLGVDVFFVISGFVITKIIYENLLERKFNLKIFYVSRFLRLFPSLFFMVVIVCFVIFLTFQLHPKPEYLINTGLSSLAGLSNYYLIFIENDYFNSFDENVFEHMWSLSIEFQFYIFYPLLVIFLFKVFKNKHNSYIYFFILTVAIYILSNLLFKDELFYHTGSRLGELLIGSFTFFYYMTGKKRNNILILSILFIVNYFFNQNIFYLIISVCFLTSFIILTIKNTTFTKNILNNKFLLIMGDASYSIYLWHLPAIYFSNLFFDGFDYYFFAISISLILSFSSFLIIEKILRESLTIKYFLIEKIFTLKTASFFSLTFILFLFYVDYTNSRNLILKDVSNSYFKVSKKLNLINFPEMNNHHDEVCHENYKNEIFKQACFKDYNSNKIIYFFGDSSMLDFYQVFKSFDKKSDKLFSSYNNSSFYKPIFKIDELYLANRKNDLKSPVKEPVIKQFKNNINFLSKKYDDIFLIFSFNHQINFERLNNSKKYFKSQQDAYLKLIKELPKNVKLIFIKDTPYFKYSARKCATLQKVSFTLFSNLKKNNNCDHKKSDILKKMNNTNNMFKNLKKNNNIMLIDLEEYFCNENKCRFYTSNISETFAKKFDGHHFTVKTSIDIKKIFNLKFNQLNNIIGLNN
jgi:peptidoglycan/LPS O-acetylase OafA/YrhL